MSALRIALWSGALPSANAATEDANAHVKRPKAVDRVCAPGAMFTMPTHEVMSSPAHLSHPLSGMPAQAATFVAGHL